MKERIETILLRLHRYPGLRIAVAVVVVVFMGNLAALVELIHHPGVPYFTDEHLIIGGVTALVTAIFFVILGVYVRTIDRAHRAIKTLKGLLPICSACNKIRTPDNTWHLIEKYISERTEATFTHSLCPDCSRELYGMDFSARESE